MYSHPTGILQDIRNACCWPTAKGSHAEVLAAPGHHQAQRLRGCASVALTGRTLTCAGADIKQILRCVGHMGGSQA